MGQSSILGGQRAPEQAAGRDTDLLGPSDSSDSGSDVQGERAHLAGDADAAGTLPADLASDTDAAGTGERGAAVGDDIEEAADISPDRITGNATDALDAAELTLDDVDELAIDDAEGSDTSDEEADETASR